MELKREKIDADAVNALAREEMIDLLLTSYWDKAERANLPSAASSGSTSISVCGEP